MGPAAGMAKFLGRSSYARGVGRNVPTEGVKGPRAGAQRPTSEGYKQDQSTKKYMDKDATIRSKAGALDGILSFHDDES